jgi:Arylsulfotransferase (ASST)
VVCAAVAGCRSQGAGVIGAGSLTPLPSDPTDAGAIAPDADVWTTDAAVVPCTISAQLALSPVIPTVGVVTWSSSLPDITRAEIQFGRSTIGAKEYVAPVDLTQPDYRTLLLGMKGSTTYLVRVVASNAQGSCASPDYTLTTGPVPASVPSTSVAVDESAPRAHGFIVTSTGLKGNSAFIIDTDGAVVWWSTAPGAPSRVHMSWDGTQMYMMALNVQNKGAGEIEVIDMDGGSATALPGFEGAHHDLTATPDGFATLLWNKSGSDAPCSLVEWHRSGGDVTTVVADLGTVYTASTFHPNAVHYYPSDDSYTLGDRNPNLFVKLSRAGDLIWQFGGGQPKDPSRFFSGVPTWSVNHGHQLLSDGTFMFFNNTPNEAWAYALDTTHMTATATWHYQASGAASTVLGDVQRLPDGNTLVTFSTSGQIHEVDPTGRLVALYTSPSYGYAEFRTSLYGPPPY